MEIQSSLKTSGDKVDHDKMISDVDRVDDLVFEYREKWMDIVSMLISESSQVSESEKCKTDNWYKETNNQTIEQIENKETNNKRTNN